MIIIKELKNRFKVKNPGPAGQDFHVELKLKEDNFMKTLIGGSAAVVLGIIGIVVWIAPAWELVKGSVPAMLLLGGSLAIYLGFDELRDTWKEKDTTFDIPVNNESEKQKQEIDELKKEIEELKSEKPEK